MKSVAIKEKRLFEIKEIPEPVNESGYVVINVEKTGICGSDIHYWADGSPVGLVMGHEFSGTVLNRGSRTDLNIGSRVTALPISPCGHCYACQSGNPQYCPETWNHAVGLSLDNPGGLAPKLRVREDMVIKVPDNITDSEVAMVEPVSVGYHAINLAKINKGDKVLVIGGGIIGLVSAMFAKKNGASLVVVSETNEKRGAKSVTLGVADEWVDAKKETIVADMKTKTNGGFDKVIECCGNSAAVSSALMMTRNGGTLVLVGVSTAPVTVPLVISVLNELKVYGAIAYTKEEFNEVINMISNKEIEVTKFIDKIVSLDEVQSSYEELTSGLSDTIKILVDPNK